MIKKISKFCLFLLFCAIVGVAWNYYEHSLQWSIFDKKIEKAFSKNVNAEANIAFVSWELSRTGEPIMLARLARMLKENNYNVAVFHKNWPTLTKEIEADGIPVIEASITKETYDNYMRILKKHFDLVIVCDDNITLEYSLISEILPTIWWLHETAPWSQNDNVVHYLPKKEPIIPSFKQFVDPLEAFYFADIVTVSEYAKDSMVDYVSKPVEVITNAISVQEIEDSKQKGKSALYHALMKRKKEKVVFLQIGKISLIKGQHILLQAVRLLPEEYKNKALFYIIGRAPDEFSEKLMNEYKDLSNVIWTGELTRNDVNDYYRTADVLLHPSTEPDAAPCVIAEAAMYHIPTVMSDYSGSDYIVKNGDSGFVIPRLDAYALRDKIMWFIEHQNKIHSMGERAYQYFLETSMPETFFLHWKKKIDARLQERKNTHKK